MCTQMVFVFLNNKKPKTNIYITKCFTYFPIHSILHSDCVTTKNNHEVDFNTAVDYWYFPSKFSV